MPRENRKRGKKHKKEPEHEPEPRSAHEQAKDGPSWIVRREDHSVDSNQIHTDEAPFGYVDADVKAYFRTVDIQIRDWQDTKPHVVESDDLDPNEERRLFFVAALTEMTGKEKQLATDPDCSQILERMIHSMDDFVRRVFMDSLAGSYEVLLKNRFASHVCQTILSVANETVSRESRGIFPNISESSEHGELRIMTQLVLDFCEEIKPIFTSLIVHPFASHVIRTLMVLLWPTLAPTATRKFSSTVRSKKSAAWAARVGPMKSVFAGIPEKGPKSAEGTPDQFHRTAAQFVSLLRDELGESETRALATDKVASPVLQMVLEIEADLDLSDVPDSLMDRVLVGLIAVTKSNRTPPPQADFVATLLRDPTSSHLLETLVSRAPSDVFAVLWSVYFIGALPRLAVHPIANFVVAKSLGRCSPVHLAEAIPELAGVAEKLVKRNRTGVLRAMVDRAAELGECEKEVNEVVLVAFGLQTGADRKSLVSCAMRLVTLTELASPQPKTADERSKKRSNASEGSSTSKTQGALLLQSLLRLSQPHNQAVVDSIRSLPTDTLIEIAQDATGSRIMDVLLESQTVSRNDKRAFVTSFIGHFQLLADSKIGSRVADRCWDFADPYLREKIARSLTEQEQFLAGSQYGKYFARRVNLPLLKRRPDEWKNLQDRSLSGPKEPAVVSGQDILPQKKLVEATASREPRKRKREMKVTDEIDALFEESLGGKIKKAALGPVQGSGGLLGKKGDEKDDLDVVFSAIRAAPREERGKRKA